MPAAFVIIALSAILAMAGVTLSSQSTTASSPGHTLQNTTLPSPSQAQALADLVEHNQAFIAAENGSSYQFISYAGFGISYRNGTQVGSMLVLYFDHCAPSSQCGMINGPVVISQLQVYTTMTGQTLSIYPITNSVELNTYSNGFSQ